MFVAGRRPQPRHRERSVSLTRAPAPREAGRARRCRACGRCSTGASRRSAASRTGPARSACCSSRRRRDRRRDARSASARRDRSPRSVAVARRPAAAGWRPPATRAVAAQRWASSMPVRSVSVAAVRRPPRRSIAPRSIDGPGMVEPGGRSLEHRDRLLQQLQPALPPSTSASACRAPPSRGAAPKRRASSRARAASVRASSSSPSCRCASAAAERHAAAPMPSGLPTAAPTGHSRAAR